MAKELRIIQLEYSELCGAVQSYLRMNLEIIGAVTVTAVSVENDGQLSIQYTRAAIAERTEPALVLGCDHTCAALIRFCLENNIPLPRKGEKAAVRSGNSAALRIQCDSAMSHESIGHDRSDNSRCAAE